jgi:hypothetical protein
MVEQRRSKRARNSRRFAKAAVGAASVALLAGSLQIPSASAAEPAPGYCKPDKVLRAKDLPRKVNRKDCDLAGRTIVDEGMGIAVPPPGEQIIASVVHVDMTGDLFAVAVDSNGTQTISGVGDEHVEPFTDSAASGTAGPYEAVNYDFETSGDTFGSAAAETGECSDDFYRTIHGGARHARVVHEHEHDPGVLHPGQRHRRAEDP